MERLIIYESSISHGPLSLNKDYYRNDLNYCDRVKNYKERLDLLANHVGFDGNKVLIPMQKSKNKNFYYPDNTYIEIDDEMYNDETLWKQSIYGDYAVLTSKHKGLSVAARVADCPVVILYDINEGVAVLGHCGMEYIDKSLPITMLEKLKSMVNTKDKDVHAYISSCISVKNYFYDKYPNFTTNTDIWKNSIIKCNDLYYINLKKAIYDQLKSNGVYLTNMYFNSKNTYSDDTLYSNRCYKTTGNVRKKGRYLVGCYYK